MLLRRRGVRGSFDGRAHGLIGGVDLLVLLDGALVKPAGTELLVLRQGGVWLFILIATEPLRSLQREIVGDGARGTHCHWLAAIQTKLYLFFKLFEPGVEN